MLHMSLWRVSLIFAFLSSLPACGIMDFYENKGGVGIPPPSAITSFVTETESGTIVDSRGRALGAGEYLVSSIAYTNEKCHAFFNILEHYKQDSELISKVVTAAVAAGSPLLALSSNPKTIATVSSSLLFANQYNQFASEIFAFTAYKEVLMDHVIELMASWVEEKKLAQSIRERIAGTGVTCNSSSSTAFFCSRQSVDLIMARSLAADYASLCSLAQMRKIVGRALNATTSQVSGNKSGALQPSTTMAIAKN